MLRERIKRHEGFRLYPYWDTTGNLTIGYGRCLSRRGISKDEAELMLGNDIAYATDGYSRLPDAVRWNCNEARRDVFIEMIFQLGVVGVLKFKKMLAELENGDFGKAADEMLDSEWHKQTPTRCRELSDMMRAG